MAECKALGIDTFLAEMAAPIDDETLEHWIGEVVPMVEAPGRSPGLGRRTSKRDPELLKCLQHLSNECSPWFSHRVFRDDPRLGAAHPKPFNKAVATLHVDTQGDAKWLHPGASQG